MFKNLINKRNANDPIGRLASSIAEKTAGQDLARPELARAALGMESSDNVSEIANGVIGKYQNIIDEIEQEMSDINVGNESAGADFHFTEAQHNAGAIAMALAGSPEDALANGYTVPASSGSVKVISTGLENDAPHSLGLEAFDERENKRLMETVMTFNLLSSRQDEFGETLFPTITVSPDEAGLGVVVNAVQLYRAYSREIAGKIDSKKQQLRRLIDAFRDYTVIDDGKLKIVPEFVAGSNNAIFYAPTALTANVVVAGTNVLTGPLATGQTFSLIGVSQNAALISAGVMDESDALDPALSLDTLIITTDSTNPAPEQVGVEFQVNHLFNSTFTSTLQNHHRDMILAFENETLVISDGQLAIDGLTAISLGVPNGSVVLNIKVSGVSNLETADTAVYGNEISVAKYLVNNVEIPLTDPNVAIMDAALANMGIAGFTLEAYRTNSNRRTRGNLAKVDRYTYLYPAAPTGVYSVQKPVNDSRDDNADLSTLVSLTRTRASVNAVTSLLDWANRLGSSVPSALATGQDPQIDTPSVHYVRPFYEAKAIDLKTTVDSIASSYRRRDIRGALMAHIGDSVARMVSASAILHGMSMYYGGTNVPPLTVIVATDGQIASYLSGENAVTTNVGGMFDLKVVSHTDERMTGRMIVTFGVFDGNRNSAPNPINFGACAYVPEVTVVTPISRNGRVAKELAVDPRFTHIPFLPVMADFTVSNFSAVLEKVILKNAV